MIAFAYYLLKVVLCSGFLFFYYHIALRNKFFHQWNRFYLLASVVLSLLVPCLQFNIKSVSNEKETSIQLLDIVYTADEYVAEINTKQTYVSKEQWSTIAYSTVSIAVLILFILALLRIRSIVRSHSVMLIDDIKFVNTEERNAPFSFLNYVFWNRQIELNSPSGEHIFKHELVHVREKHSLDKLFIQLVLVIYWTNPFFWFIRRELKIIHEFIADQKSVGQSDAHAFATMILRSSYPSYFNHLTNQFFQSSIKRRLAMLTKGTNPKLSYLSRILALPLMAFIAFAFTVKQKNLEKNYADFFTPSVIIDTVALKAPIVIENKKKGIAAPDISILKKKSNLEFTPLIIIDGKEVGWMTIPKIEEIIPRNMIGYIYVMDKKTAQKKYGKKGKEGVLEITSKKVEDKKPIINTSDTTPHKKAPGMFFDTKNKIAIKFDEIVDSKHPQTSKVPHLSSALLVVNGEKVPNDIFTRKTIITKKLIFIESDDAIKIYGKDATNGAIVFEDAHYIEVPTAEYYKDIFYPKEKVKSDPDNKVFEKVEIEAQFPGGPQAWRRFLERNLNPNVPVNNKAPKGTYTVVVQYIVGRDGSISDVKAKTDHGYGMEAEAIRVIKKGPVKWIPAFQNGHTVNAYRKQPITFSVAAK
jgi:hypothetical protein